MTNMFEGPMDVIGLSLTLDSNNEISSSEAKILLERATKETNVEIGFFSVNGNRVTIRIFGNFEKRGNFLDKIVQKKFIIQKATCLIER